MKDADPSKKQLISELEELRQRIAELEASEAEQKQVIQKLQEGKRYFESILFNMHEDIMVIDQEYKITDANKAFLVASGRKRQEVIGRHCYEISHSYNEPCEKHGEECVLQQVFETGNPSSCRHQHIHADGSKIWVDLLLSPLKDENGSVERVIETVRDVTELVNAEKAAWHSQKLASIGRLAAGVTHEINNPLTTILTGIMLIQEDTDSKDSHYEELQTIVNEILRCRKIVSSLLEFARQTEPIKKEQNLNDVIRASMVLTRKQAAFKGVTIEQSLSENVPLINLDKDQIEQVLINLTLNAVEATDPEGRIIISTKYVPETGIIELKINDTGKGIPQGDIGRIFEPFFSTKESGTGLGLAVTHGIVERHGGTIDVESKPGQGSSFTIRLPFSQGGNDDR